MRKESQLICKNCDGVFYAKKSNAHYCSNACRQSSYLERWNLKPVKMEIKQKPDNRRIAKALLQSWIYQLYILNEQEYIQKNQIKLTLGLLEATESLFEGLPEHIKLRDGLER